MMQSTGHVLVESFGDIVGVDLMGLGNHRVRGLHVAFRHREASQLYRGEKAPASASLSVRRSCRGETLKYKEEALGPQAELWMRPRAAICLNSG
jgi:hypothetical protein